jgi:hypothetical protein
MTDLIENFSLWAAQDALMVALAEQDDLSDVAQGLGFPVNIEIDHVWIEGGGRGKFDNELSGGTPTDEAFQFDVFVYTQLAEEYVDVRDRLKTFAAAVGRALASATFAAAVPSWTISDWELDAGTDGTNR